MFLKSSTRLEKVKIKKETVLHYLLSLCLFHESTLYPQLYKKHSRVGLKVSTEKMKAMRINTRNQDKIVVNEVDIEHVDEFT